MLLSLVAASNGYADTSIINEYDANGNLVTGDGKYYEYNDANQLIKVRQGVDQTGPVIAEYFYDFSGQRVKKIENGVVTYYVGKHFEKQVGGSNEGNTSYYFGDGGERVAKKDPTGNIFYYHLDHLDGVNAVTDSASTVVAKTDYLPFGDVRAGSSGSEKYSYTGKEKDKTDLYYFDARYNSPEFRHFTQADLAEPDFADPQDLNRYSYVGNNPLSYVDPDGFKKKKDKHKKDGKGDSQKPGTGHKFPEGWCTWYVAQKRYVPWDGNAGTWLGKAEENHFKTGNKPKKGAIMVLYESWWGHVAYVEKVDGDSFTVSEMNYKGFGKRSERTIQKDEDFIKGFIY